MSGYLVSHVETMLRADLDGLTVSQLQAHALELRVVGERLLGRANQVLAVLQERSGGQVLERSQQRPAPGPVQDVVQGTADGDDSGAVQPEAFAAPAMPLLMSVQTWWREATRVAGTQAGRDVRRAGVLMRFPVWGQAVTDGILTPAQAEVLCRLVGKLPDTELLATQTELVTVAAALNPVELGQWVRHLIATWCEPELDREQDRAEAGAWLQLDRRPDGRLAGRFIISSEDSEALLTVLEPLARRQGLTDARSAGRRRAEALVEVFTAATRWLELPHAGGRPVHVSYVVPSGWARAGQAPALADLLTGGYLTLLNPDETVDPTSLVSEPRDDESQAPAWPQDARPDSEARPRPAPEPLRGWWQGPAPDPRPEQGRLVKRLSDPLTGQPLHPVVVEEHVATGAWSGPQTRARIEATLCDARISRVLRDAFGQVHSLETLSDQITTAQRRAVSARDRHCTARGCTRPPAFTDLHHLVHREDGGATSIDNLVLLCRRHHVLWHRGRLTLTDLHVPWLTTHAA